MGREDRTAAGGGPQAPRKMAELSLIVRIQVPGVGEVHLSPEHAQQLLVELEREMALFAEVDRQEGRVLQ